LPFPVIASVRGHCYTGGLELVWPRTSSCCGERPAFAERIPDSPRADLGLSQRLPSPDWLARAKEMMFTSRTYSGTAAAQMGLVQFCCADSELGQLVVDALCADVLATSRRSNRANQKVADRYDGLGLDVVNAWISPQRGHGRGLPN